VKTQSDYETEATIAVLGSPAETDAAIERLRAMGIPAEEIQRDYIPPATYQCLDTSLGEEVNGLARGSALGLMVGTVLGTGVGWWSNVGSGPGVGVLTAIGAVTGAIVGSIIGAAASAHYDDDPAASIDLRDVGSAEVLSVQTHSHRATVRAREALRRCGALALLDPELYPAARPA
jgi:hypothetical protein